MAATCKVCGSFMRGDGTCPRTDGYVAVREDWWRAVEVMPCGNRGPHPAHKHFSLAAHGWFKCVGVDE